MAEVSRPQRKREDLTFNEWSAVAIPMHRETPLWIIFAGARIKEAAYIQSAVDASLCRRTPKQSSHIKVAFGCDAMQHGKEVLGLERLVKKSVSAVLKTSLLGFIV